MSTNAERSRSQKTTVPITAHTGAENADPCATSATRASVWSPHHTPNRTLAQAYHRPLAHASTTNTPQLMPISIGCGLLPGVVGSSGTPSSLSAAQRYINLTAQTAVCCDRGT